jgi:carbamoyl-phosphate synthase large subunit
MRRQTVLSDVPYFTTIAAAAAAVDAIEARRRRPLSVCSLQEYHARNHELATLLPPSK